MGGILCHKFTHCLKATVFVLAELVREAQMQSERNHNYVINSPYYAMKDDQAHRDQRSTTAECFDSISVIYVKSFKFLTENKNQKLEIVKFPIQAKCGQ